MYFAEEWAHSVVPDAYVHIDFPERILIAKNFDDAMAPFAGDLRQKLSQLMMKHSELKVHTLMYNPSLPPGYYGDRTQKFNTHTGTRVKPLKESPAKFLEFMRHLFPSQFDRHEVLRWIATLLARPSVKMRYGLLLLSDPQGVGKSTLGDSILAPLIARHNYTPVSENDVLKSVFNYWCSEKRLVFVHEIHTGGSTYNLYNSLKSLITDSTITVHKKYAEPYPIENWVHLIICSNHQLRIDDADRRFFVPEVTREPRSADWWREFHKWLHSGGLGAILQWACDFLGENDPVNTADTPPLSVSKEDLIQGSYAPDHRIVVDIIRMVKEQVGQRNIRLLDTQLVHVVQQIFRNRETFLKPHGVRKIARREGLYETQVVWNSKWPCMTTNSRLLVGDESLMALSPDALRALKLTDISEVVAKMTMM
jgi:hypothetical protein